MSKTNYLLAGLSATTIIASGTILLTTDKPHAAIPETERLVTENIYDAFSVLLETDDTATIRNALAEIDRTWQTGHEAFVLETARFAPSFNTRTDLFNLLMEKTKEDYGQDIDAWYQWLWNEPHTVLAGYDNFKANLYRQIDPAFEKYFRDRSASARIRLDEVFWGGVVQDGIPPLRNPEMISSEAATYLDDNNIVFGIEINGDARAYPKRILAWHELFTDTVGGVDIAGVYCTLCGTVIPYKTEVNGVKYVLGTSGFLYRSNKLMYDKATQSLWSTSKGEPVLGPLVDQGIVLEHFGVVTTTWREWKRRHPDTTVLSLNTGHRRNYGEGVAYKDYFATDRLMFDTPFQDDRLENKQEVLALRFPAAPSDQLAIDTDFLDENPLYTDQIGFQKVLVLTDTTGANRVFDPEEVIFVSYDSDSTVTDNKGIRWRMTETALTAPHGRRLSALPYRRAFWFGWYAAFPGTKLVK